MPDNRALVNILKVKDENDEMLKEELQNLITLLLPILDQNKKTIVSIDQSIYV